MKELCMMETPNGPCTMPKGHQAPYHRHRMYNRVIWKIYDDQMDILEQGEQRIELNYAITRALEKNELLTVKITKMT